MRAPIVLLCLVAAAANGQQSEGVRAPPEDSLTPPPITSAPRDEPPPVLTPASPEDDFLPPPFPSTPAAEPPPPPRAVPTPPSQSPPPPAAAPAPAPSQPPIPRTAAPAPSQPSPIPPPRPFSPAEPARQRAARYSRYSAGAGGPILAVTEGMVGLVTGAMLGSAYDVASDARSSDGYTGAIIGGLTLGTTAIVYQYFFPVGRYEGVLAAGAATASLMAGLTIANSRDASDKDRALLTFATTQAGILSVLLLTAGGEDVSAGDVGLVGSVSLYGFVIAGLIEYIHARQTAQGYNYVPVLVAPAIGMALGGLLAIPLELSSSSAFDVTLYPLGAGLVALLVGARLADDVVVAKTVLGTVAGTFLIVTLANIIAGRPAESPEKSASTFQAIPIPVVMTAGRGNDSLAAGPGLFLRF